MYKIQQRINHFRQKNHRQRRPAGRGGGGRPCQRSTRSHRSLCAHDAHKLQITRAEGAPPPLRSLPHSRAASSPGPGCTAHVEYAASLPRPLVEAFKCAVRHVRATVRGAFFLGGA